MSLSASDIDWSKLSERARWTLQNIAYPLSEDDLSHDELAARHGRSRRWVKRSLDRLGEELRAQGANPLRPLTSDEYDALKADIEERGVLVPIVVDEHGQVIDGAHRLRACNELKIDCPRRVLEGLEPNERHAIALALNLARRQVSASARKELVRIELIRDPSRSDRQIAAQLGVSHPTVATARRRLEQSGDVESSSTRIDTAGRQQPGSKVGEAERLVAVTTVRGTRDEIRRWTRAATNRGMPLSQWLRTIANEVTA